jgi:hypothetical protein
MGHHAASSPPAVCQAAHALPMAGHEADGLQRMSGRIPRRAGDTQSIIMSPGYEQHSPWT